MTELTSQTAGWLDLMRSGDSDARRRLIEHACERLRGLARKMLRQYPRVHRWEETDDVFCEAVTRLHRALETVRPELPRDFYNLAATQIRRVLIDMARRYYGPEGIGSHHDTAAVNLKGNAPPKHDRADLSGEPSGLAEWTEFHEHVEALPEEVREVFNLLWYEQMSQEEAAKVLGVTTRTIRRRWHESRFRLQKACLGEPLPE
ncbi:MAG: sigma-70 family RNA polymerase sigma factor [Planctomycetota bacterium]